MKEAALTQSQRILAAILEKRTGQILSENRLWRLETSLRPVLRDNGLRSLDELVSCIGLEAKGELATQAVDALLNNETSFFRDAHIFRLLERGLLPALMEKAEKRSGNRLLRVWCAGCSTGQEAFSLAMSFLNNRASWPGWRMQILATDVSHMAIKRAQSGTVPQIEVQRGLAINDLLRWMEPSGDQWRVGAAIRDMIDFRVDDLCMPGAAEGEYDLVLCRNVLLYFGTPRKNQIFKLLSRHTAIGGYLLLGAGETIIGHTSDFTASREFRGTYERIENPDAGFGI